jgi:predicted MPP superfamily phosphohydrolase
MDLVELLRTAAQAVATVVEALRPVSGRLASYFVLGSNDYFRPQPTNYFRYFLGPTRRPRAKRGAAPDLVRELEQDGWIHLKNERIDASVDGTQIEIAGLDDPHIHRHDIRTAIRRSPDRFGLAIVHSPDPAAELVALGYDLVVAGHTHGGQVRLPLVGALVTNGATPRAHARGLIRMGDGYLHVSPGLGTSKFAPFRFLCRPEATLLELVPQAAQRTSDSALWKTRS